MVPLVHGQWTEVRTLAVGEVQPPIASPVGPVIHTTNVSYFSRRTDSTTFGALATRELHRRGIAGARRVGAVVDGAVWCESFVDLHYPEAVRMLDFAHAAEYLTAIAQTNGADGPLLSPVQLVELRHTLKHAGPAAVLPSLRARIATQPANAALASQLTYLETRVAQLQYPQFIAEGWPIGSGMVESANKLVVEDRLKGAGMHWADANVNPMLALRNAVCNDRWEECWEVIEREQCKLVTARWCCWHLRHPRRRSGGGGASSTTGGATTGSRACATTRGGSDVTPSVDARLECPPPARIGWPGISAGLSVTPSQYSQVTANCVDFGGLKGKCVE